MGKDDPLRNVQPDAYRWVMADPVMPARFDHETLDVYRLELEFIAWLTDLLAEIKVNPGPPIADITNQVDRSSLSSLLNTAEGNSKRQQRVRARFFDDARGSAAESAACLDAMVAKRLCTAGRITEGKSMLLRIVQMLSKLVDRFDPSISRL